MCTINSRVERAVKSNGTCFMFKGGMILESLDFIVKAKLFNDIYFNYRDKYEGCCCYFLRDPADGFLFCATEDWDKKEDQIDEIQDALHKFRDSLNDYDAEIKDDKFLIFDKWEAMDIEDDDEFTVLLFQLKKCTSLEEFLYTDMIELKDTLEYTKGIEKVLMSESEIIEYLSEIENNK